MRKLKLLVLFVVVLASTLPAQETTTVSESRKKNMMNLLDYRFRGGYYTFEKIFNNNVIYPEILLRNCIMGMVIVSFEVNCQGEITDFSFKNPLHKAIHEEIADFFDLTNGQWNECKDNKYTRFEIPIQFRIEGVDTNTTDAILVCEDKSDGYICNGDDYYYKKATKSLEKKKGKKAIEYLDILIKHDPYNLEYYDMKKEALSYSK